MKIYFQVFGPNEKDNLAFIEKTSNRKFSMLNNFQMTTKMELDKSAFKNYLILTDKIEFNEKQKWMEYYYNNIDYIQLITEIS